MKLFLAHFRFSQAAAPAFFMISLLLGVIAVARPPKSHATVPCDTTALIAAVQTAVNASGAQVIDLTPGCTYTSAAVNNNGSSVDANGLPRIGNAVSLTINGRGATIQRDTSAPRFRFFQVLTGATLSLNDLTLSNGFTP